MTSAVLFQFMPPLLPSEYQALTESIRAHGVQVPVIVDENGAIIDGHHRDQIATELGVACPRVVRDDLTDAEKRTLAISLNKDRRHLTREQVRALIAESIKADPDLSDRAHAQRTGASHPTVGKVRAELEQVERFTTSPEPERIDPRTCEVVPPPTYKPTDVTDWTPQEVDDLIDADERELEAWKAPTVPAPPKVVGLDGKTYTRPEPKTAEPRRAPLPPMVQSAGWDLTKSIERLQRLAADDRFNAHKKEVAPHLRSHLTSAIEACQDLLDRISN